LLTIHIANKKQHEYNNSASAHICNRIKK